MGFNLYGYGCIQPCRIEDGYVIRCLPSGKEERYQTQLGITIPEQTNLFMSPNILFYLIHDGLEYVGRRDGSISIYQISNNLLVGFNSWTVSMNANVIPCGYKIFGSLHTYIVQDKFDMQSLYTSHVMRYSTALKEPMTCEWDLDKASIGWVMPDSTIRDFIFTKQGGKQIVVDRWEVQDLVRSADCKRFL